MTESIDLRPVQVFLDTKRFIDTQDPQRFSGGSRDFFQDDDKGFALHKDRIRAQVQRISQNLTDQKEAIGFVRVHMREEALGKSYRPLGSLFTPSHGFGLVGTEGTGEMLFQVTPAALSQLDKKIEAKAELTVREEFNEKTNKLEPRPSGYRSEVGAISDVALYDNQDRVPFSADEAINWLAQPETIGEYIVELFRPSLSQAPDAIAALISRFRASLESLPCGIVARPFLPNEETTQFGVPPLAIAVRLLTSKSHTTVELPFNSDGNPITFSPTPVLEGTLERDLEPSHHQAFLDVLSEQALVRTVDLSPLIESAPACIPTAAPTPAMRAPNPTGSYPVVGIIDGGVAAIPELRPWRVADAGLVPTADRDESHGTFIAGLVAAGGTLNPHLANELEPHGCMFYDLDIFPRKELRQQYFRGDIEYFFDLLDEKIKVAKGTHRVRVFNLSFGLRTFSSRFAYTALADRLDRLARSNDVILVVSAGNLPASASRPTWSKNATDVVTMLAASASGSGPITPPAEHLLGLTVGALNPPGVVGHEERLPTTYTRRGPGVGGARKPDVAHFGGTEASSGSGNRTGLASFSPSGACVENCGTSFAAPNVAATIATLDHRLQNSQPREVLLALPIHRAVRATPLAHPTLRHISREFVGFGLPPIADELLVDDPYAISLVFSEILRHRQRLEFPFSWPQALVKETGACRGDVRLTLAYTPPIDADHKDEAQRVQLEAHLHQEAIDPEDGEVKWESRLTQDGSGLPQGMNKTEKYLLKNGLKWSPIKRYTLKMTKGRGSSSNWRMSLEALTRAGSLFPAVGVPFAIVMTITDPTRGSAIHDAVRNSLQSQGLTIADITLAHRVRPRQTP